MTGRFNTTGPLGSNFRVSWFWHCMTGAVAAGQGHESEGITAVTFVTMENSPTTRAARACLVARRWAGPMALVAYVPAADLASSGGKLLSKHVSQLRELLSYCPELREHADIHVVTHPDRSAFIDDGPPFPINTLRNIGTKAVRMVRPRVDPAPAPRIRLHRPVCRRLPARCRTPTHLSGPALWVCVLHTQSRRVHPSASSGYKRIAAHLTAPWFSNYRRVRHTSFTSTLTWCHRRKWKSSFVSLFWFFFGLSAGHLLPDTKSEQKHQSALNGNGYHSERFPRRVRCARCIERGKRLGKGSKMMSKLRYPLEPTSYPRQRAEGTGLTNNCVDLYFVIGAFLLLFQAPICECHYHASRHFQFHDTATTFSGTEHFARFAGVCMH